MSAVAGHAKGGPQVRRGDPCSRAGAEAIVRALQHMNPGKMYEVFIVKDWRPEGSRGDRAVWGVREVTSAAIRRTG